MRVGVCGQTDWVASVQRLAEASRLGDVEVVGAGDDDPRKAQERLASCLPDVDAVLFDGRLHHDRVLADHPELAIPMLYLPVTRPMVYPTLIRAIRGGTHDVERISIDSVDAETVRELYEGVGISSAGVHTVQYHGLDTTEHYTGFHERLFREGTTTGAVTSMRVVMRELERRGVPVIKLAGPEHDGEERLRGAMATLLSLVATNRAPDTQLVLGEIAVSRATLSGDHLDTSYWQQELALEVHKILLQELRAMGGAVSVRGAMEFSVTSTMSGFRRATQGLRTAPFLQRIQTELGVVANAGFGLGGTTAEAVANARTALARAESTSGCTAVLIDQDGTALSLPVRSEPPPPDKRRGDRFLRELVVALRPGEGSDSEAALVVDGATVARVMEISERSARRNLDLLVDQGLAWPMKSTSASQGGRPRLQYRLVAERLSR